MKDTTTKSIIQSGIDKIDDMIAYNEEIEGAELHNRLYNEDYYIVGTYQAKQELAEYDTFQAIEEIKQYERNNFGEVTTDLSDPEKVLNMLAYIKGEEALNECETLASAWDETLTTDQLKAIKTELEAQL